MPYMPFGPERDNLSFNDSEVSGWEDFDVFMATPPSMAVVTGGAPEPNAVPQTFPNIVRMHRLGQIKGGTTLSGAVVFPTIGYMYWDYEDAIISAPNSSLWPSIRDQYAQIYSDRQGQTERGTALTDLLRLFTTNYTTWLAS